MNTFHEFGLPVNAISETKFMNLEANDVFTFGRRPTCIGILTNLKGVEFAEAYPHVQSLKRRES